jgi:transcriptional regulator with XRE-family HTH domain
MGRTAEYISDLDALADRLYGLRDRREVSQRRLAREVGVSPAYISRIERGERQPSLQTLEVIARALGTTTTYLMTGETTPLEKGLAAGGLDLHDLDGREHELLERQIDKALFEAARYAAREIHELRGNVIDLRMYEAHPPHRGAGLKGPPEL